MTTLFECEKLQKNIFFIVGKFRLFAFFQIVSNVEINTFVCKSLSFLFLGWNTEKEVLKSKVVKLFQALPGNLSELNSQQQCSILHWKIIFPGRSPQSGREGQSRSSCICLNSN